MQEDQFESIERKLEWLEKDNRELQGQIALLEQKIAEWMKFHSNRVIGSLVTSTVMGLAIYDGILWLIRKFSN